MALVGRFITIRWLRNYSKKEGGSTCWFKTMWPTAERINVFSCWRVHLLIQNYLTNNRKNLAAGESIRWFKTMWPTAERVNVFSCRRVHLLIQSELTVSGLRCSTGNCLSVVSIPSASWLPREFLPWNGCPPSSKPWQTFSDHFCEQAHTLSSLVPLQSPVMIQPCSWQIHEAWL